jgi:hypothetical protein
MRWEAQTFSPDHYCGHTTKILHGSDVGDYQRPRKSRISTRNPSSEEELLNDNDSQIIYPQKLGLAYGCPFTPGDPPLHSPVNASQLLEVIHAQNSQIALGENDNSAS